MRNYFLILIFMFPFFAFCQIKNAEKVSSISINADTFVGIDGFGNYFYLKNEVFYKKSEKTVWQYVNFSLGAPSKIDIINPLKIVLFYEKFNTMILLDNQLNELQKIDFSKQEIPIISSYVGLSSLNNVWLFNSINQQLMLYNLQYNLINPIGNTFSETPKFYYSNFNYFYWINSQNEFFYLSIFGSLTALGKIDAGDNYQIINDNQLLICRKNEFYLYDFNTHSEQKIFIVEKSFKNFYYKDQILSIFTNEEINNYKIISL